MRLDIPRPLTHLGSLAVGEFMRRYWQKRPVMLRQALPVEAPVTRERLFRLTARDAVESRLVTAGNGRWRLAHGPFQSRDLPDVSRKRWTLLVQGVDLHDAAAHALLSRFRFIADARLDDLMVSYATDGGGVGAHVDSYDVFLLQVKGQRRWRISRQRDLALRPGLPLKVLAAFRPAQEWLLDPGDMLYLPPGVAHEGVAVGECITCSIGFRAPCWLELLPHWFEDLEQRAHSLPRLRNAYRDPDLRPTHAPGRLPAAMIDRTLRELATLRPNRRDAEATLLRALSEPKPDVVFDRPRRARTLAGFIKDAQRHGIVLDRRTRLLYSGRRAAINGEPIASLPPAVFRRLADHRVLLGRDVQRLDQSQCIVLHEWYVGGWLHLGSVQG